MKDIIKSWACLNGNIHSNDEILAWVSLLNKNTKVNIKKVKFDNLKTWYYNKENGQICNKKHTFFQISGLRHFNEKGQYFERPIMIQNEIGYLGMLCKKIDGILNFLIQAKIEPGNINKVQLSPTIQSTKSNFLQAHGVTEDMIKYIVTVFRKFLNK